MFKSKTVFLAIFLLLLALPAAAETCNSYGGGPQHEEGYGYYCGGSGGGCTECVNFHPGGVQVCVYRYTWNMYCTDYGQEFQWI